MGADVVVHVRWWSIVAAVGLALAACKKQKPAEDPVFEETVAEKGVTRLTPEQFVKQIYDALGVDMAEPAYDGQPYPGNFLLRNYAVPLGGVDFVVADRRSSEVRVSTLLVAHAAAHAVAENILFRELYSEPPQRVLFVECEPITDFPGAGAEAEARWQAQIEAIYWRLFSRAPDAQELAAIRTMFETSLAATGDQYTTWHGFLYALLSTTEAWHS